MVAYQYLGRDEEGRHVLALMNPNGTVRTEAACATPCRIIDVSDGRKIPYSTRSIIGAAFEDAFRGKLKVADWAKDEIVEPVPAKPVAGPPTAAVAEIPEVENASDEPWDAEPKVEDTVGDQSQ